MNPAAFEVDRALSDIIRQQRWRTMVVLYDDELAFSRAETLLLLTRGLVPEIILLRLPSLSNGSDTKVTLPRVSEDPKTLFKHAVLLCTVENSISVINEESCSYPVTTSAEFHISILLRDLQVKDRTVQPHEGLQRTAFLESSDSPIVPAIIIWKEIPGRSIQPGTVLIALFITAAAELALLFWSLGSEPASVVRSGNVAVISHRSGTKPTETRGSQMISSGTEDSYS
ncbi:hypothetical protein Bbelb_020060 [Branchiostoma belcheri]|nr:hypothetical protein Bbelb_020060 [Branchiostoma belcheri]